MKNDNVKFKIIFTFELQNALCLEVYLSRLSRGNPRDNRERLDPFNGI
jgi:hypothetical protein